MKYLVLMIGIVLTLCSCGAAAPDSQNNRDEENAMETMQAPYIPEEITPGSEVIRGFVQDNVYHSPIGDIHYSSAYPEPFDPNRVYGLFISLPGWEGLYFQGVGSNMGEDFAPEARNRDDQMIVLCPQLSDWGETSARETIALTEYFLEQYHIDPERVYLEGYSGGGETGSLVLELAPELYTAYLMVSSQWDGDLEPVAEAEIPVYMAIGENDSYYGSGSLKQAYADLHALYEQKGLSDPEIDERLVLDVKDQDWFSARGYEDQHGGGNAFAKDEEAMGWLFSRQRNGGIS